MELGLVLIGLGLILLVAITVAMKDVLMQHTFACFTVMMISVIIMMIGIFACVCGPSLLS